MILIQQHYRSSDPARQDELDRVRTINEAVSAFGERVGLDGDTRRCTFSDLFELGARRFPGQIVVVANSDIAFDDSIATVSRILSPGMLVALTRWDDATAPSMEGRLDDRPWRFYSQSQDTWVFLAGTLPAFRSDFSLGVPRCENRLAYEAAAAGVVVVDPALSICTRHHHATNVRSWKRGDAYAGPLLFPRLTTLDHQPPEAFVVVRYPRTVKRRVVLDGSPESFSAQLARRESVAGRKLGIRSPFYWRS